METMHFPLLHTLNAAVWTGFHDIESQNMSNFILLHQRTLEVLDLSFIGIPDEDEITPHSFPSTRSRNRVFDMECQPHLKSFRGNVKDFHCLLRTGLHSMFAQLENLDISVGELSHGRLLDLFVQSNGQQILTFSALRILRLQLYTLT
jgi:hypothetical protein